MKKQIKAEEKKNGHKYKPLSTHVLFAEARIVAIGQIYDEKDPEKVNYFIARLRDHFDDNIHPFMAEATKEEKEEIGIFGKVETRAQFITKVEERFKKKLEKRKKERNKRKNLKKRKLKKIKDAR